MRTNYSYRELVSSPLDAVGKPEYLIAEIRVSKDVAILFAVVYRPPQAALLAEFAADLDALAGLYTTVVIAGDFNADLLSDSFEADYMRRFCSSRGLFVVPFGATHLRHGKKDSFLDLCLVSDNNFVSSYSTSAADFIAGHRLIAAKIELPAPRQPQRLYRARDYRAYSQLSLLEALESFDWESARALPALESRVGSLNSFLTQAFDQLAPYVTRRAGPARARWSTPELRLLEKETNRLYRVYRCSRLEGAYQRYREAKSELLRAITEARTAYYTDRLESSARSPNQLWGELRRLGLASPDQHGAISFSPGELNAHFAAICTVPGGSRALAFLETLPDPSYSEDSFYFADISPLDLASAIRHFSSQSRGVDDLSLRQLKESLPVTFPFILETLNSSLSSGTFPALWKKALVLPLPKVRVPATVNDYRPISLLCSLSKILERIVLRQVFEFLDSRSALDKYQSGFRPGYSTQTALLKFTEDVRRGMDNRLVTLAALFDFKRAFDTVPHVYLLEQLRDAGFSNHVLRWFASYLEGRVQAVVGDSGERSHWLSLDRGVPQGSVLGPLLFLIAINGVSSSLTHCQHLLYADDLQIYVQCSLDDFQAGLGKLQEDTTALSRWAISASLTLNPPKTKVMVLGSSPYLGRLDLAVLPRLELGGELINYSTSARDLGVLVDCCLRWREQVAAVSGRVHGTLRQLSAARPCLNFRLRKLLVVSLIFPILDYCAVVYNDLSLELSTKLQRLLNASVRFVCGFARDASATPHRRSLGWLCVKDRRLYHLGVLFFTVRRGRSPEYLNDLFVQRPVDPDSAPPPQPQELLRHATRCDGGLPSVVLGASSKAVGSAPRRSSGS